MGFTPRIFWEATTPPTTAQLNAQRALNATATLELEGAQAPQSKTIASGSISPTASYIIVDTEGSAAADDLDVINPVLSASENLHDGMVVYLKAADSGRVVTVKNSSSANGINTYDGNDYVLSTTHWLKLQLRSGKWYEVEGRAMEAALAAATAAAAASTPATTTARGIGRVATSADLVDGATISNGPAFLAAGSAAVTTTPTANAVPQADASGKLDGWVSLAGKANLDMDNLTQVGTTAIAHYSRLSGRYINVTAWLNGSTYTAPADGAIYWVNNISTSQSWYNEAKNMTTDMAMRQNGINQTTVSRITLDVRKGDVVNFYADNGNVVVSRFYYAEGAY